MSMKTSTVPPRWTTLWPTWTSSLARSPTTWTPSSLRVPTSTVSVVDFTAELEKETSTEELRQTFRDAAKQPRFKGVMQAVDEPLVSIDYKGDPHSSSVDLPFTSVLGKEKSNFVKVVTWYDNEWGYSCRTADLAALMAKSL